MRVLYMGTPDFAVPALERLINSGYEICGVVTQPDRPKGRGMQLSAPPVKETALSYDLPVFQPETFKDEAFSPVLKELCPEIIVVVAYGRILPKYVLAFPAFGCVNVHGSLLPKYRGAAPIQRAVIDGVRVTGVSTMQMDAGMDTGDILLMRECPIGDEDTSESMFEKLSILGAEALLDTLDGLRRGVITATPQQHEEATYAPMISKEDLRIDWSAGARAVLNLIRGGYSWPIAFTECRHGRMKVYHAAMGGSGTAPAGTVLSIGAEGLEVAAGDGNSVFITDFQVVGARRMSPQEYFRGHESIIGDKL